MQLYNENCHKMKQLLEINLYSFQILVFVTINLISAMPALQTQAVISPGFALATTFSNPITQLGSIAIKKNSHGTSVATVYYHRPYVHSTFAEKFR